MNRFPVVCSGLLFLSVSAHANSLASDALGIIKKNDCLACHSIDKKVVGPAFKDVAARYKGKPVVDTLVHKIKVGGSGNWGTAAMIPHPNISDQDLKTVVKWILSGAPAQ